MRNGRRDKFLWKISHTAAQSPVHMRKGETGSMGRLDTVIICAGAVRLAIARAMTLKGRETLILESENAIGTATSSRNSGVIHAGIYYGPGSLKARCCVKGRDMLYA